MSQYTAQTSGQSRIAPMGVWILACGAACALSACSTSTSFRTGTATEPAQSGASIAPSFASTASQGRFVGLYGTVDETTWDTEGSDGQVSLMQVSFATEGADFDPEVDPTGSYLVYAMDSVFFFTWEPIWSYMFRLPFPFCSFLVRSLLMGLGPLLSSLFTGLGPLPWLWFLLGSAPLFSGFFMGLVPLSFFYV